MHPALPPTFDAPLIVPLRHRVIFTRDAFDPANAVLRQVMGCVDGDAAPSRAIALVDSGVLGANPGMTSRLRAFFAQEGMPALSAVEEIAGGERAKTGMATAERVVHMVEGHGIDRQSFVIAIGGGAVLDAVGLGAAMAHRGVRLVRMPTTVLAQDDAGMAVKNGINLGRKKNFIGTFAVPHAVVCDSTFLQTTPDWSWCGGFSEAVKIALLRDPALFDLIERDASAIRSRSMEAALPVIERSAELHWRHIVLGGDPFESRSARPLDFGHWLAHRLEGLTDGTLPHGQAVAVGVAVDSWYSACAGLLPAADARRTHAVLRKLGLPVTHELLQDPGTLLGGLEEFREHLGGSLTVTLLRGIGDPVDVHEIDAGILGEAIRHASAAA